MSTAHRTDSASNKLELLAQMISSGRHDVAMSLAESLKETLSLARQSSGLRQEVFLGPEHSLPTEQLGPAAAAWARGWRLARAFAVAETVGIARRDEPLELVLAVGRDEVGDPWRELRVASVDGSGRLAEVPSQMMQVTADESRWYCRLLVMVDAPLHAAAHYLVFLGNPFAELPEYETDLRVRGEEYRLDVENHHYAARLSRQMGQLERITSKREHGLELYAGGKGHGEPPCIDWGHDYVDTGHFQKFRMRNWSRCPNHEVWRGPLCVAVRRWGFPHSPIHPLFAPARIHMDQSYMFYAGLPYFIKQGRMEVLQDLAIEAMRDDEWVLSGYSYSRTIWFDRQGKFHEGSVPAEQQGNLWGVGFYHPESRDAFVALWLEHSARGAEGPNHGGVPTLHYAGHGQLWSRYPAERTRLQAGAVIQQRNAYLLHAFDGASSPQELERLRHQLLNPVQSTICELPAVVGGGHLESLARPEEFGEAAELKSRIWKELGDVRDEQLYQSDLSIVDLGYVNDVRVRRATVTVVVTMPHRGRPVHEFLESAGGGRVEPGIRERLLKLPGVRTVLVKKSTNPQWTSARLSLRARDDLGVENG